MQFTIALSGLKHVRPFLIPVAALVSIGLGCALHPESTAVGTDPPGPASTPSTTQPITAAPAGFDGESNGLETPAAFDADRDGFEEVEQINADPAKNVKGGLGPVYNDTACANCHQNPITGSAGQTLEIRAGFKVRVMEGNRHRFKFVEPSSGSLIHQRATDATIQEHVPESDPNAPGGVPVHTFRLTTNILGDGYVEVIPDEDILAYQHTQPRKMRGLALAVPSPVQANGPDGKPVLVGRIGRFGWKCQEASLMSFSAGAYLNEMGITSPLNPQEDQSNGKDVGYPLPYDPLPEPEDKPDKPANGGPATHPFGHDVESFARFMRATKAPPQAIPPGVNPDDVRKGEALFGTNADAPGVFGTPKGDAGLGCCVCHRTTFTTPKMMTLVHRLNRPSEPAVDRDIAQVPRELGDKVIHPYSDFMLHNVGTGDGITQSQHAQNPQSGIANLRRIVEPNGPASGPQTLDLSEYNLVDIEREKGAAEPTSRRNNVEVPGRHLVERDVVASKDQNLDQRVVNMIRSAPLWGLRTRVQLLHDGSALTVDEAIRRHKGQAEEVEEAYEALTAPERQQLLAFLDTLGYGSRPASPPASAP